MRAIKILFLIFMLQACKTTKTQSTVKDVQSTVQIQKLGEQHFALCTNGVVHLVKETDFQIENFCTPINASILQFKLAKISHRNDGKFDIICQNSNLKEIHTAEDIISGLACRADAHNESCIDSKMVMQKEFIASQRLAGEYFDIWDLNEQEIKAGVTNHQFAPVCQELLQLYRKARVTGDLTHYRIIAFATCVRHFVTEPLRKSELYDLAVQSKSKLQELFNLVEATYMTSCMKPGEALR